MDIGKDYYRDDGLVSSMLEHEIQFGKEFNIDSNEISQKYSDKNKNNKGEFVSSHLIWCIYSSSRLFSSKEKKVNIFCKAVSDCYAHLDKMQRDALYLFAHGYAEANAVLRTKNNFVMKNWFADKKYSRLYSFFDLAVLDGEYKKTACSLVGSVLTESENFSWNLISKTTKPYLKKLLDSNKD